MTAESDPSVRDYTANRGKLHPIVGWLEEKVKPIMEEIRRSDFWELATSPDSDPADVKSFMAQVYLEIANFLTLPFSACA